MVRALRRLAEREEREARRLCVVEGERLVWVSVGAGAPKETLCVLAVHGEPLPALPPARRTLTVSARVLAAMASTETPQAMLAVVGMPEPRPVATDFAVAVDGLQDPGNLGTLLRAALAFGAGCVAVGPGSADPWSTKALRAAAGATFRLPLVAVGDLAAWLRARPGSLWALQPRDGVPLPAVDLRGSITLVVGSEAHGVSAAVAQLARSLTIPMPGPVESLNAGVALALAAYEVARQREGR